MGPRPASRARAALDHPARAHWWQRPCRAGGHDLCLVAGTNTIASQDGNDFDERGMRKFRWNMNVGREPPRGFSLNAEVWNGRIAMFAFFWVLIQKAIVGKGCITVIQEAEHWWQLIVPGVTAGHVLRASGLS